MLELMFNNIPIKRSLIGPGPADLIGYYNPRPGYETGYYGQLNGDGTAFFNSAQLRALTGNAGAVYSTNINWQKFVLDGKLIYIPSNGVSNNLTWQQLYQQGVVYGIDDVGAYPSGTPVNQLKIVTWGAFRFKIRLVSCGNTDPILVGNIENNCEWGRLMFPISSVTAAADCENGVKWTNIDLGVANTWILSKQSTTGNTPTAICPFESVTHRGNGGKTSVYTFSQWRPVLELIP